MSKLNSNEENPPKRDDNVSDVFKVLLWQADVKEVDVDEYQMINMDEKREDGQENVSDYEHVVEAGKRAESWFERIERLTTENRQRSIQNQNTLNQIDLRTVWITRLIIGLFITIVGGYILNIMVL